MKKLLLLSMLSAGAINAAFAQKSQVIELDSSATKASLFSKSMTWVAKTWKEANNVVQSKDPDGGVIIVKGGMEAKPKSLGMSTKGITMTTVTIRVKDGKAKIEFESTYFKHDLGTVEYDSKNADTGIYKKWKVAVDEEMDAMITDYKAALEKKVDDF